MTEPEWIEVDHRIVEEITRLRARLAEVEAERDLFRETHDLTSRQFVAEQKRAERAEAKLSNAEARLAEVEAERDDLATGYATQMSTISGLLRRIRAVEELCDAASGDHIGGVTVVRVPLVRAAAAGDRAEHRFVPETYVGDATAEIKELRAQLADERARNQHDRDLVRELTAELHRLRGCEHTPDWHAGLTWCTNCGRSAGGAAGDDRG